MTKRICINKLDNNNREIERRYLYFDIDKDDEHNDNYQYLNWLYHELYSVRWNFEYPNEDEINQIWLEEVDSKGCIKSNFRLA